MMGIVYHGSMKHGLKRIEPRKSTHGSYVYATPEKALALIFSSRCGDDLTYDVDHFDTEKNGPWELVENIPFAFDKMFSNSSSIYTLSDNTFKNINTGFEEVVSDVGVDVINEEYFENVYEGLLLAEQEGLLILYRYPNKPKKMKQEGSDILDKWRYYKNIFNREYCKEDFDKLVCLHPELLEKINELSKEFDYDYIYKPQDLIDIFKRRVDSQLHNKEKEYYIESSYLSICNSFPSLTEKINKIYEDYKTKR